jgi:hypothetical protein
MTGGLKATYASRALVVAPAEIVSIGASKADTGKYLAAIIDLFPNLVDGHRHNDRQPQFTADSILSPQ